MQERRKISPAFLSQILVSFCKTFEPCNNETIGCFTRHQINMSRIDSRPIPGKPWEYSFYLDFEWEVGRDIRQLTLALEEAGHNASYIKLLGLYSKDNNWEAAQQ